MILKTALLLFKYILRDELRNQFPEILGLLRELTGKKAGMGVFGDSIDICFTRNGQG